MTRTPLSSWTLHPALAWLLREGWRLESRRDLFEELALRLIDSGVPLSRMALYIPTLHPELFADVYFWRGATGKADYFQAPHTLAEGEVYRNSPLHEVIRAGVPFRRRLTEPDSQLDFPILVERAGEGATDHYILPVRFSRRADVQMSFTADRSGGFLAEEIALFDDLADVFAPIVETFATRVMAERLLDTYVGRKAGQRVMAGQIVRGSGETIRAAIFYADLAGFTELADRLPREDVITVLNAYFDCMTAPIEAGGGEVLEFIGDAVLAIFAVEDGGEPSAACDRALTAALSAVADMASYNTRRRGAGEPELGFGIALHLGDVLYGNIGGARRLDFTVIGPAVNYANRLERVCRESGRSVVMSAPFAALLPARVRPLGSFRLRSIAEERSVFVPGE